MNANTRIVVIICVVLAGMLGLVAAAPSLYNTFCRVTGWGGTTQRAEIAPGTVLDRKVTVRFDGTVAADLPWSFKPEQVSQTIHIGETALAYYEATNTSDRPIVGTATFNVQPAKAGLYFMKVECFCFTEQVLQPGETMSMPVTYFIDPELTLEDRLDDVREITLSYTFYRDEDAERELLAAHSGD
ncbi:cytochrome c oxidase assembly protein [Parvularcula oceani]|uniref:cytochrome c oxidase assembly protein n=1 Tax=Parvularcula oceani TaxID=1247963 RepID=UPI0004E0B365|nr:cytochrome c oxidase assembly protein [Parvularcula oceani]